jgi:hypothetical protein
LRPFPRNWREVVIPNAQWREIVAPALPIAEIKNRGPEVVRQVAAILLAPTLVAEASDTPMHYSCSEYPWVVVDVP